MKKLFMVLLLMVFGMSLNESYAQKKKREMVKTTYAIDLCCGGCKAKIMNSATSFGGGVKDIQVDLEKDLVYVTYDQSKVTNKDIIEKFKKLKFDAKVVKTEAVGKEKKK